MQKKWIQKAVSKNPGSLTRAAKSKGMTPAQFCATNPGGKNAKRCNLRSTLMGLHVVKS